MKRGASGGWFSNKIKEKGKEGEGVLEVASEVVKKGIFFCWMRLWVRWWRWRLGGIGSGRGGRRGRL